jgi:chemotaxis protein histidine kinase CheA
MEQELAQELAQLRQQVKDAEASAAEEQRRREEAEASAAEEQRRRQEAESSAAEEQRRREEAEASAAEEQRRREEAEASAAEEQRRREEAEASSDSRLQDLREYLEYCHESFHALRVVTDKSSTTQGHTTDPTNRQFPKRIVPWDNFLPEQDRILDHLATNLEFSSKKLFPSQHQLDYVHQNLRPISSEAGLRDYVRETVENQVRTLIDEAYKDEPLRNILNLRGKVAFESHTNTGEPSESTIEEEMEQMIIAGPSTPIQTRARASEQRRTTAKPQGKAKQVGSKSSSQRRGGLSDQFCILDIPGRGKTAILSIEYKAPHKFSLDNIIAGLDGEIRPAEDVINQEGTGFDFVSRTLAAAVITQLFSDMIQKGVRWGFICTGEANIFLHIPDEPSVLYYHLSIPKLYCKAHDENSIYRTAIAQVSAFILRATSSDAPSQSWRDEAEKLPKWPAEYIDVLKGIPLTPAGSDTKGSEYISKYIKPCRSPIITRGNPGCNGPRDDLKSDRGDPGDKDDRAPNTPSPAQVSGNQRTSTAKGTTDRRGRRGRGTGPRGKEHQKQNQVTSSLKIMDRPFCTHLCLLGLAFGGAMDKDCPNLRDHPIKHIDQKTFLYLIRNQLATDRGSDADCKELCIKGARGALFKIRLSSYGYTLVAKGVEWPNVCHLEHEHCVYDHIRSIQGSFVPVCLGSVELELPYYYDCGKYIKMLFLSWAGRPLFEYLNQTSEGRFLNQTAAALQALHKLQVLHKDPEPRNVLWNEQSQHLMLVDFERAEICRQPLGTIMPNRKRKRGSGEKKWTVKDEFVLEVERAKMHISRCVGLGALETR